MNDCFDALPTALGAGPADLRWAEGAGDVRAMYARHELRKGLYYSIKAGFNRLAWTSELEVQTMQFADVSSRVHYLTAVTQPHGAQGDCRKHANVRLLLLRADPTFAEDLAAGMSLAEAATIPTDELLPDHQHETVVVAIWGAAGQGDGSDGQRLARDSAKAACSRRGFGFHEVRDHFGSNFLSDIEAIDREKVAAMNDIPDRQACMQAFADGPVIERWHLETILGGGRAGRAKLHWLHFRQAVSVDFRNGIRDDADVYLVRRENRL